MPNGERVKREREKGATVEEGTVTREGGSV